MRKAILAAVLLAFTALAVTGCNDANSKEQKKQEGLEKIYGKKKGD